ncbi:MAG: histidine kinase [Nocardioides sp.]|nr:histidine kinase [Nocardioides sp.]
MDRPTPAEYQPQLRPWGHTWRLVLCLGISATVWLPVVEGQVDRSWWWVALDVGLGLVAFVLVCKRRRHPVPVAVALAVLAGVSGGAAGPAVLAAVSLATRRRWREIVPVGVLSYGTALLFSVVNPGVDRDPFWLTLSANLVATVGIFGWGMYLGSRRELIWTLQSRAERAEAEQELRTSQARSTERSRIAREMHDVLAHRISQISLHAGALAFRDGLSAGEVRENAAVIQQKAHEALNDLRDVLGVLREPAGGDTFSPQPTYADLPQLVADARENGLNVELRDDLRGHHRDLPDPVGRAVYRIVQEGLTNAHKHAPGAAVHIRLSGGPDEGLRLHLDNPLGFGSGTPGAGLGLVGLSERAALLGGRLEHRRERDSFVLDTWIPWAA